MDDGRGDSDEDRPSALDRRISRLESEIDRLQLVLEGSQAYAKRLEVMLRHSQEGLVLASESGTIEFVNDTLLGIAGLDDQAQLIGRNFMDFTSVQGRRLASSTIIPKLRETGKWVGEVPLLMGDERHSSVSVACMLVPGEGHSSGFIVASFRDTSTQHQLEEQLRQSQKMEAIGTLAGGVAHDMNNVLAAIMNLGNLMKMDAADFEPRHRQSIEDIIVSSKRGRDLARDLLGFARKGKYLAQRVDMNEVVEEVRGLLRHTISKSVEIQLLLDDSTPWVDGDHSQLSHALMNICLNSVDAMDNSGVITISTDAVFLNSNDLTLWPGLSPGRHVRLEVIDSGRGMSPEVLARVFEPFFTTKSADKGTGLGLAMVYGTVRNHSGAIRVHSTPGAGTKVSMLFPPARSKEVTRRSSPMIDITATRCSGHVLLVDDEDMIRRSAQRLLTRIGYEVSVVSNGLEAVDFVRQRGSELQMVILDLLMPVMDGEKAFQQIKKLDPELPILLSSGYARDEKVIALIESGAVGFIQKPFDVKVIAAEIAAHCREL